MPRQQVPADYGYAAEGAQYQDERRVYAQQYAQKAPAATTNSASKPLPLRIVLGILAVIRFIGAAIARGFMAVWKRSKPAALAIVAIVAILLIWLFNSAMPHDRIREGMHVGEVDVSNMTVAEASTAIDDRYLPSLNASSVYIFADDETASSADIELQMIESEAQAEMLSFEEAQSNKRLWVATADMLGASLPSHELAEEALEKGNSIGFIGGAFIGEGDLLIEPRVAFDDEKLSSLSSDINSSLGSPVENFDLTIEDDGISIYEGCDGDLLDDAQFAAQVSQALLSDDASAQRFVADIRPTHYDIDEAMAIEAKAAIEASIPDSVEFASDEGSVSFDRDTLMGWISTRPSQTDGIWYLEPYIDETIASKDVLDAVNVHDLGEGINVTFDVSEGGDVTVYSSNDVALPNIDGALEVLDDGLFGEYRTARQPSTHTFDEAIGITMSDGKSQFSLNEALSYGLVTEISSFTTQFTNTSSTVNRRDNIHLVSDTLNNSVARADGGSWSFLGHAGPMEEEDGYKEAGVIVAGQMDQGVGGGVCQVATTVFNAVYEAGLQIDERHNHTLFQSSYPAGLDAAVSYPGLDLIWSNPTSSDVLLVTSYTDYSVTVTLLGIDPEYEVITETGEWEEGKKHTTTYELDEMLREGASYIKTAPTDGTKINVRRTVKDKDGDVVDQDLFASIYSPINRVIAYGKGSDMSELRAKYAEDDDD